MTERYRHDLLDDKPVVVDNMTKDIIAIAASEQIAEVIAYALNKLNEKPE